MGGFGKELTLPSFWLHREERIYLCTGGVSFGDVQGVKRKRSSSLIDNRQFNR